MILFTQKRRKVFKKKSEQITFAFEDFLLEQVTKEV